MYMAGKKKSVSEELSAKLTGLQSKADEQQKAYQSSRDFLYENLVDTYLWWRDARDEPGYLDKLYEDNGVKVNRSNSNKPSFTGVLKVIWRMSEKYQVTISLWNGALGIIDEEYIENKALYRKDTKQRLIGFINDNGGLTQLRKNNGWQSDDESEEPKNKDKPPKSKTGISKNQIKAQIDDGIKFFKSTAKPLATINAGNPLIATKDDLVAVIARRNKHGELEILATTDDDEQVNQLAASCAVEDLSNAPSNISILAEAILTHSLPKKMMKMASRLAEPSKFKVPNKHDDGYYIPKKTVRLTMRPKRGDMIISLSRTDVSVVTIIKPHAPLISSGNDLMLKGDLTNYIRQTYVYEKSLSYISSKPSTRITKAGDEYVATHLIQVTNDKSGHKRNIYFYNPAKLLEEQRFQADYNDDEKFVPLWTVDVTPNWWAQLQAEFTSRWINNYSPNITRPQHKKFEIRLTNKAWKISFSDKKHISAYGVEKGWEHSVSTPFSSECKVKLTGNSQVFSGLSKDVITVFNAMYEQNVSSRKIRIEGNMFAMRITYKTKLGEYTIYVPASDTFERDETFFKRYEYV
jgi:hypothetical protein